MISYEIVYQLWNLMGCVYDVSKRKDLFLSLDTETCSGSKVKGSTKGETESSKVWDQNQVCVRVSSPKRFGGGLVKLL